MLSKVERFWIAFILRFAFGFFFLFAALNIFDHGPEAFSQALAKPFESTWLWKVGGDAFIDKFLYGMPFVFAALSVPILTGIFLKPALRLGALLFVCLGLGKYIQNANELATTASDFSFALMICLGLYALGRSEDDSPKELGA